MNRSARHVFVLALVGRASWAAQSPELETSREPVAAAVAMKHPMLNPDPSPTRLMVGRLHGRSGEGTCMWTSTLISENFVANQARVLGGGVRFLGRHVTFDLGVGVPLGADVVVPMSRLGRKF